MSLHNASIEVLEALAPKRQRGRDRVAAILAAATELFTEKGYDAVTMTEIAARSSTAIGSLYRFFPTKDVLVSALLERYGTTLAEALADIVARAPDLSVEETAAALVAMGDNLRAQRTVTLKLLDVPDDGVLRRQQMRATFKDGLARILSGYRDRPYATDDAPVLLLRGLLKLAWSFEAETPAQHQAHDREVARMIALYVASEARKGGAAS